MDNTDDIEFEAVTEATIHDCVIDDVAITVRKAFNKPKWYWFKPSYPDEVIGRGPNGPEFDTWQAALLDAIKD